MEYADRKEDPLIQNVRMHQHNNHSAVLQIAKRLKTEVWRGTRQVKDSIAEKTKERWRGKMMHGKLPCNLDKKLVDIEQSFRWLKSGDIKGETRSEVVVVKDQVLTTNHVKNKILKEKIDGKCQLGKQHEGTIDHLTSGCSILAKNEYLMKYNKFVHICITQYTKP